MDFYMSILNVPNSYFQIGQDGRNFLSPLLLSFSQTSRASI